MTGLSTHDTKRGEDVRARLAVLSEIPERWAGFAELFASMTAVPNPAFGYFLAQTVVGAGPIERERMHAYVEKAMREASDGTTWTAPDEAFEDAVHAAVDLAYDDPRLRAAWDALDELITVPGWSNSVGQKLVQLTMPGVPGRLPGHRAVGGLAGRSRQPACRSTSPCGADAQRDRRRHARRWTRPARPSCGWFATRCMLAATAPSCSPSYAAVPTGGSPPTTWSPSTVVAPSPWPPGSRSTLAAAGGWGDTTVTLPGTFTDQLSGRTWSGEVAVAEVLADLPVALLLTA